MEEALLSLLQADEMLVGLTADRITWGRRSQFTAILPAIVLTRVSGRRDYTMNGASGLVESRVQVDCFGKSYSEAKATARAVLDVLSGYSDFYSGGFFQGIFLDSERDRSDKESGADRYLFVSSMDFLVWHQERVT